MKALVLRGAYDIAVEERPEPQPDPGEVVVEVIATGICGSDFHGYSGENGRRHPGQVMGHETVGRIDELGSGRDRPRARPAGHHQPGDGLRNLRGLPRWSAAMVQPPRGAGRGPGDSRRRSPTGSPPRRQNVVVLPESMPAELGALVEPLAVGYHAVRRGGATAEDRVLVIGGGPIGQACLLAARRLGVTNLAVSDVSASRRDLCARLGGQVIDPTADDLAEAVAARLGRSGQLGDRRGRREPDRGRRLRRFGPGEPDRAGGHGLAAVGALGVRGEHSGADADRGVHLHRRRLRRRPPHGSAPSRTASRR